MTRWQKIVHKIRERLSEIQVANGFRTDAGLRVVLIDCQADTERPYDGQTYDTGLVIQIDPAEPAADQGTVRPGNDVFVLMERTIGIYGFRKMADRSDWFDDAEEIEADVKEAIFKHPEDQQYYRQIGLKSIRLGTASTSIPGYGDEFLVVEVALQFTYVENLSSPWEPDS